MTEAKPKLSTLSSIGLQVNWVIASGHSNAVSFREIYDNLEAGTLLEWLDRKIPDEFDFGLWPAGSEQRVAFNHVVNEVAGGLYGQEDRKLGIKTSGLHLLLAFILEAIQRRYWV